jgi:RimJ/RimL family protein N-acetyltransferase
MWATEADIPEIEAFLTPRTAQSMFPLANLRNHGLNGPHRHSPNFWLIRGKGQITDVLTLTRGGLVLPQCPSMDWSGLGTPLEDREITGIIGPANQCRSFLKATGLDGVAKSLDHDEPQYELNLSELVIPEGFGELVPLCNADKDQMIEWRKAYAIETIHEDPDQAQLTAERDYETYTTDRSHVVLMDGETALCATGFNARLPDIVQIGGVYTPPEHRRKGHARRAVALHLAQARDQGVSRATLFSANEYASRAYQAIGFTYVGQWTLCLFNGKHRAHV